ncbi:MAG: FxsA family protein [Gammaproteobacteria bacterium]|nr:FxsA family protein [Gammaproteobacteria bacterium]
MIRNWPILFIVIPLVELYFIIVVGEMIGAFWTIVLVLLTAVIGVNLLRIQGMSTLTRAQQTMAQGQIPAMEMMEGVALAVAGVLLITPGFITDSIGFLCLIPATRKAIIKFLMARATVHTSYGGRSASWRSSQDQHRDQNGSAGSSDASRPKVGRTIEGEYHRED